jgi:hypothetical protein
MEPQGYQVALLTVNTITAFLIAIIGYFIKRTIDDFGKRIDKHDQIIFDLAGHVQKILGFNQALGWNGKDRRETRG